MNPKNISQIIKEKRLPKDELDEFWHNFRSMSMQLLFTSMSLFFLFFYYPEGSMKPRHRILFFVISATWLIYTLKVKSNERNLIPISTNCNVEENISIINSLVIKKKLEIKVKDGTYFELMVPFVFGIPGHKLTLIAIDNYILLNLRNIGSYKGRAPYLFGIDTFKTKRIRKELKLFADLSHLKNTESYYTQTSSDTDTNTQTKLD